MNLVRSSRTAALRPFVLLVAGALACRDDATKRGAPPARTADSAPSAQSTQPPTEVVIARLSQPYSTTDVANAGTITGTVTLSAPLQPAPPQSTGRDSGLCGATIPDESLSQQGNTLGGVVVWLDDIRRGKPVPLERRLELESDKCRLVPRVQAAVVASAVNVIGHDDFRQHLSFLAAGESEARAAILLGRDEQVIPTERPFKAPGMVAVRDADHAWPTAYVAVFDHPYYAVTAPNGTFTIDGVPPGTYTVAAWHERTKRATQSVVVAAGGVARVSMALVGR